MTLQEAWQLECKKLRSKARPLLPTIKLLLLLKTYSEISLKHKNKISVESLQ